MELLLPVSEISYVLQAHEQEVIVRVMLTFARATDDFLGDCRRRRYSERTLSTYRRLLDEFGDRLPVDQDVSKVTVDDVRRYLSSKSNLSIGTIAHAESVMSSFFTWLFQERKIGKNPMGQLARTKRVPAEDLDVVTLAPLDVPTLLAAARPGAERNAIAIAAYLGPRRRAIARLRLSDYDLEAKMMRFREKGSKMILKPVPQELADVLAASISRGEIRAAPDDYLVPPEGYLHRKGDRDDRVIWRLVKRVAERAGVETHVHALRAAFACFYLERNPDDLLGLRELLGHRSLNTTLIYLRRMNKQARMERVRTLSWAESAVGGQAAWLPADPPTSLGAAESMGAGGFEPPFDEISIPEPRGSQQAALEPLSRRLEQARRCSREGERR